MRLGDMTIEQVAQFCNSVETEECARGKCALYDTTDFISGCFFRKYAPFQWKWNKDDFEREVDFE